MPNDNTDSLANERLRGIKKIAAFLDEPERRVGYMVERNMIAYEREGRSIVSYKSWLRPGRRPTTGSEAA